MCQSLSLTSMVVLFPHLSVCVDEIPLKKAVQDETVRDEQGRRRFHGAFTGGFSAGYYNTVGSKEGWLPAAFKSSRSKKASQKYQRPEDFMDTEDLGSFGIAPRKVHTTTDFQDPSAADRSGSRKRPHSPGPIPGISASLGALIKPVNESIGVRLLCKLGWRPGQGIGPRLARPKKKTKKPESSPLTGVKIYGCSMPPGSDESDEEDENILYAPKDIEVPLYTPKDNLHGIGYQGLSQEPSHINLFEPTSTRAILPKEKKKISISGQAFGVGAFENEDEDIYARDDMSRYNFYLDDGLSEAKPKPKKPYHQNLLIDLNAITNQSPFDDVCTVTASQNVMGLVKALEGFHLAKKPPVAKPQYPAPTLPSNFRPVHNPSAMQQKEEPKPPSLGRHQFDAKSRGSILENKSVFSMLRPEDSARLQSIMAKMNPEAAAKLNLPPPALVEPSPEPPRPVAEPPRPIAEPPRPIAEPPRPAVPSRTNIRPSDFKPFAKDEEKQKRYDVYLTLLAAGNKDSPEYKAFVYHLNMMGGCTEGLSSLQPRTMTEWERQRERDEFERSAVLYQPLSTRGGGLGSRFVSAGRHDDDDRMVEVPLDQDKDQQKQEDQAAAAKMKMFGRLTRETFPWHPAKVLCKRFNVPNPYPDSTEVGVPTVKRDKFSIFNFLTVPQEDDNTATRPEVLIPWDVELKKLETTPQFDSSLLTNRTMMFQKSSHLPQISITELHHLLHLPHITRRNPPPPGLEEEEAERPPMDLFKAVFGDTSSEDEEPQQEETPAAKLPAPEPPQPAVSLPRQPASGVFANLDLDALNRRAPRPSPALPPAPVEPPPQPAPPPASDPSSYGPALPPSGALPWESSELAYEMYKNKDESLLYTSDSSKKHKKHKKHKSDKKRKKKKKKNSKETYEADQSSSDSEEDLTDSQILERKLVFF
ncbi:GPATCH1 [Cordylochernes scorpioides]|uniref:GPATCH1 n=1 Tax=Cordylochernes scorpioides TaxID=51811 RepID=A0ABY6JVY8_9ARAC|nr:GPATCH1 [Cordylochernes scorpioides]